MIDLGKVFILGDSYSTFENFIPKEYAAWYVEKGRNETDVNNVNQTWWKQLIDETNSELLLNCSYSGTTICNTGYNAADCTEISFIGRLDKLIKSDFFVENHIDTFIIFGGTNDSWANSPVGELMYSGWEKADLFSVLPAFCYMLSRIKAHIPKAKVTHIINTELKEEIVAGFKSACESYGVSAVELTCIDKMCGHPSIEGMRQIKNQLSDYLNK